VVEGKLTAIWRGIVGCAAAIQGARGGVDIPADDVADVKAHIARYYEKADRNPPWEKRFFGVQLKSFAGCEVKDEEQGIVTAIVSTFGVVDLDGDIVEPGAMKSGPIRVSAYGHTSWEGALPVGKGYLHVEEDRAIAEMQFFMDTTHGRETFKTVKNMGELQEWSYSLQNIKASYEEIDGKLVRRIKAVDVHEVSPVLMGASIGTRTLGVKSGLRFSEHIDAVLADVIALNERAQAVAQLRAEKGETIAEARLEQLEQLYAQLSALKELLMAQTPKRADLSKELQREYLRFVSLVN